MEVPGHALAALASPGVGAHGAPQVRVELRESGIRFAITSGMACVHFGLQAAARVAVYEAGLTRGAVPANLERSEIATLAPPIEEMLP